MAARRILTVAAALAALLAAPAVARAADPATEFAQIVSLQQAAQAGLVQLTPKGEFEGDSVAVDLKGARIPGHPVRITVRIEILGTQKNGQPWPASKAAQLEQAIESRIGPMKASDGSDVTVDLDVRVRSGTDPKQGGTSGYHQIVLDDRPPADKQGGSPNTVSHDAFGPNGEHSGDWGANENSTIWAHETGHLLGLPDRYLAREPDFVVDGMRIPLPKLPQGATKEQMDAWWDKVLAKEKELKKKYGKGEIEPGIPKGHENDIMADGSGKPNSKPFIQSDVDGFVARAGVRMKAQPGDILLDKDPTDQNLGVGAPLDMFAPRGKTVHRDGLFAYCIDSHESVPDEEDGFDVLTSSAASGLTNYGALRAVLREIARRQAAGAGPEGPPGAVQAVWAVSDAREPTGAAEASILAAAGVVFNEAQFMLTPHPEDPNTGTPKTAAVTTSSVLPSIPSDASLPPAHLRTTDLPAPELLYADLAKRRVTAGKRRKVTLLTFVEGSDAMAAASVVRKGKKGKKGARRASEPIPIGLPVGPEITKLRIRVKRPGRYKLILDGDVTEKIKLKVRKKKRRRRQSSNSAYPYSPRL